MNYTVTHAILQLCTILRGPHASESILHTASAWHGPASDEVITGGELSESCLGLKTTAAADYAMCVAVTLMPATFDSGLHHAGDS